MYSTPRETAFLLKAFSKDHGSNQPSLPVPEIFECKYHCRPAVRAEYCASIPLFMHNGPMTLGNKFSDLLGGGPVKVRVNP